MVSFTSDSTIDGASYVFGPNRSIFTRIFWIFLFILSIFGLFYYIRGAYISWKLEPDILTKNEIKMFDNDQLFAVTVCPQQFDLSLFDKVAEIKRKIEVEEKFDMGREECSVLDVYDKFCIATNVSLDMTKGFDSFVKDGWKKECKAESLSQNWSEVASTLFKARSGHKTSEVYSIKNKTNGILKNQKYFDVLTSYGACATFDMVKKSIFKEKWMDEAYGLLKDEEVESSWTLDSDPPQVQVRGDEFRLKHWQIASLGSVNHSCNGDGSTFILFLHQPDQFPTSFHSGVQVNYETWLDVKYRIKSERSNTNIRTLHPDIRRCYFEDEGNLNYFKRYSRQYCQLECVAEVHGCHPIEIPKNEMNKQSFCNGRLYSKFNEHKYKECKCYPSCNYFSYEIIADYDSPFTPGNDVFKVGYDSEIEVDQTERFITYTLANFIADTGGYLGLFLGCSILSIVEVFFYIACKIYNLITSRNDPDETQDQEQNEHENERSVCNCEFDESNDEKKIAKELLEEINDIQEQLVGILEAEREEMEEKVSLRSIKVEIDQIHSQSRSHSASDSLSLDIELLNMIAEETSESTEAIIEETNQNNF